MTRLAIIALVVAIPLALTAVVAVGVWIGLRLHQSTRTSGDLTDLVPTVTPGEIDSVQLPEGARRPAIGDDLPSVGERT
ncbi:hypothetical protein MN032_17905 [Agromyces atrinae]|uniref:hypothetical protein n=1 Tax=Agromyces atrinae TaxID=592376 RepID=UPI001F5668BF|nr:hypothetical protein [Agromyces atrinae]MCI2959563.1 hypothetical protein [Agromyces atrinae]